MTLPVVLLVADDASVKQLVRQCLNCRFTVKELSSDSTPYAFLSQNHPELVLLDGSLYGQDAFRIVSDIRAVSSTPVMVLLNRGEPPKWCLDMPYIEKHRCAKDLAARVEAELTGSSPILSEQPFIIQGALVIGLAERKAFWRGRELRLTPGEFDLLAFLASHPGEPLSRKRLCRRALGLDDTHYEVDHHLRGLRAALADGAQMITTVRGGGCQFTVWN